MSDSTRYFQLTPDILVEYNYYNLSSINDMSGNAEHIIDMGDDNASIINNGYCSTRTFLLGQLEERFVLPINKAESKFIQCKNKNRSIWSWNTDISCDPISQSSGNYDVNDDILIDNFRLHFTSRNYLGEYDGFIITVCVYDKIKNKIGLLSQYVKRTDDPNIDPNPVIINQKLYTTYQDFTIPNISALIKSQDLLTTLPGEDLLRSKLSPNYGIMDNSPVIMSIYGVKSYVVSNNYEYYNVEKINSIYIPIEDKSNNLYIRIKESDNGDYFEIYPEIDGGKVSFSDYIYNISDGRPENFIVYHELTLIEHFTDIGNQVQSKITHREQYIINASDPETREVNENELDNIMCYRPIVLNNRTVSFTIDVKTNIINTLDNTTTIKKGSLNYSSENPGQNPKKYGKRMTKIYLGEIPAQVNVYNKKPDINKDGIRLVNSGSSNVKIENHQHSVIGFIECANVGVSIDQVTKEDLDMQ